MTEPEALASAYELRSPTGRDAVVVFDGLGGWMQSLVLGGESWFHRNEHMSLEIRSSPDRLEAFPWKTRYVDGADIGGGDFMLGSCLAETLRTPADSELRLPDHGFSWSVPSSSERLGAGTLKTVWDIEDRSQGVSLSFVRTLTLEEGSLTAAYAWTNRGKVPVPDYWSTHDMFTLTDDTTFELEPGTAMQVFSSEGSLRFNPSGKHAWPWFELADGRRLDLSRPLDVHAEVGSFAVKAFAREPGGPVRLRRQEHVLELSGDGRAALWLNHHGWVPESLRRRDPSARYRIACMERSNVASDRTSDGLRTEQATWLHGGEERAWTVRYTAGRRR